MIYRNIRLTISYQNKLIFLAFRYSTNFKKEIVIESMTNSFMSN